MKTEISAGLNVSDLPLASMKILTRGVLSGVKQWFDDPAHWAEYAAWHIRKYGLPPSGGYGCPETREETA